MENEIPPLGERKQTQETSKTNELIHRYDDLKWACCGLARREDEEGSGDLAVVL